MDKSADLADLLFLSERMGRERWREVSDVAQVVASYLRCHPQVEAVRYPGLKSDPDFEQAAHTLIGGFGPVVWYCVAGEWRELVCEPGDAKAAVIALERELRAKTQ